MSCWVHVYATLYIDCTLYIISAELSSLHDLVWCMYVGRRTANIRQIRRFGERLPRVRLPNVRDPPVATNLKVVCDLLRPVATNLKVGRDRSRPTVGVTTSLRKASGLLL